MSIEDKVSSEFEKLPQLAKQQLNTKISLYEEKIALLGLELAENKMFLQSLPGVWCCSLFVAESCIRSPLMIDDLVCKGDLFIADRRLHFFADLNAQSIDTEKTLMKVLRDFRCREMVRIAWRDLAGWSDLNETLLDLTALAEACIQFALGFLYQQACERKGTPLSKDGNPINIVVLGMGKLGAWELNYSSDIDLIFAYAEDGILNDRKETSYGEFFTRICRSLVKVLDEVTADGFVFRTDIRLRPYGDSGPIIMTFDGMEHYYLTQAREWERYAMIKARQVAGDFSSGEQLSEMIKPFVYRRYLDYGAFEELRSLKSQITQELQRKDRMDNIKLGPGGIREIEFIGQAFQLIRGGQDSALQQRSILNILILLAEQQLLTEEEAGQLQRAYCFLRQVENHIQQYQDKQTHDLPADPVVQAILAFSMGFSDWLSFKHKLETVRECVQQIFDQVFSLSEQDNSHSAEIVWLALSVDEAVNYLHKTGFAQAEDSFKTVLDFKQSRAVKQLTAKGAKVIDRLMPLVIDALKETNNPDDTLKRVVALFEQVAGRNVYLSLLAENPGALSQLLKLSSASPWICHYLAKYPVLFDELLDTRSLYEPLNKPQLSKQLQTCLNSLEADDVEQMMIKLRQFKHLSVLRIAAADIMGMISVTVVSDYLTCVAEVIVEEVIHRAWLLLSMKHGLPPGCSDSSTGFALLGFGKLGGLELGYGSDLDMVFISDSRNGNALTQGDKAISCTQFYGRLGQKIRHILDTKMLSGVLYEVDMRLRPSGDSGLLVTTLSSYEAYLKNNAWTWELQALVRGRFVAGDKCLKRPYEEIRQGVLYLSRRQDWLKKEVLQMRDKMRLAFVENETESFNLKHGRGGIVDIEFIVQFHVLAYASENKDLANYTDNITLLDTLSEQGIISTDNAEVLKKAYCIYRDFGHQQVLQGEPAIAKKDNFVETRSQVEQIWHEIFKE